YGTNMQHGFQLARSLLSRHRGNKQVIMVTDGEPTAHLDENGRTYFAYPPTFRTIQETLREVRRCTRDRIVINTFMLERGPYLTALTPPPGRGRPSSPAGGEGRSRQLALPRRRS